MGQIKTKAQGKWNSPNTYARARTHPAGGEINILVRTAAGGAARLCCAQPGIMMSRARPTVEIEDGQERKEKALL